MSHNQDDASTAGPRGSSFWVATLVLAAASSAVVAHYEGCWALMAAVALPAIGWLRERRRGTARWLRRFAVALVVALVAWAALDVWLEAHGLRRVGERVRQMVLTACYAIPPEQPCLRAGAGGGGEGREAGWRRLDVPGAGDRVFTVAIVSDDALSYGGASMIAEALKSQGVRAQVIDLGGGARGQVEMECIWRLASAEVRPDLVLHSVSANDFVPQTLRLKLGRRHRDYALGRSLSSGLLDSNVLPLLVEPESSWYEAHFEAMAAEGDELVTGFSDEDLVRGDIENSKEFKDNMAALARIADVYLRDGVPAVFVLLPFNYRVSEGPRASGRGFADFVLDEAVRVLRLADAAFVDARPVVYAHGPRELGVPQGDWGVHAFEPPLRTLVLYQAFGVAYERLHVAEAVFARLGLAPAASDLEPVEAFDIVLSTLPPAPSPAPAPAAAPSGTPVPAE